jgi:hypothetical protein
VNVTGFDAHCFAHDDGDNSPNPFFALCSLLFALCSLLFALCSHAAYGFTNHERAAGGASVMRVVCKPITAKISATRSKDSQRFLPCADSLRPPSPFVLRVAACM